jgi:zona occludens toxin
MITLITGVPGSGKTLYSVAHLLKPFTEQYPEFLKDGSHNPDYRRLVVDRIDDLLLPHVKIDGEDVLNWPDWAQKGDMIVIDEVQRHWRPESATKRPHKSITELEEHRHRGVDFIILTQHPQLVHTSVRRLVDRHIHVRKTSLGRWLYEWPECVNPTQAWKGCLQKKRFKMPKWAFGLYHSSEMHTKVKSSLPRAAIVFGACLLLIPFVAYRMYHTVFSPITGTKSEPQPTSKTAPAATQNHQNIAPVAQQDMKAKAIAEAKQKALEDPRNSFKPRYEGWPETAPAYDDVRPSKISSIPVLSGCMASADSCNCFTQQGTVIDMPVAQCRQTLNHMRFNPYAKDAAAAAPAHTGKEPS